MRTKWMLAVSAALVCFLAQLGTAANAQFEALGGTGFNVRAGVFFPTSGLARDAEGDTWFTAGAEWRFFSQPPVAGQVFNNFTLSADWYGSGDLYAIPLLVNYRGSISDFFFTAGIGIAFDKDFNNSTGTDFAWQIGAGYDFVKGPTPIYGMIRYHGTSAEKLDGLSLVVGVRF